MTRGFLYLVAVMDWHSRYVVAWRLSNTLEAGFCAEALEEALGQGQPEVFNNDQSSQFAGPFSLGLMGSLRLMGYQPLEGPVRDLWARIACSP